jgi:hypothetical protein
MNSKAKTTINMDEQPKVMESSHIFGRYLLIKEQLRED